MTNPLDNPPAFPQHESALKKALTDLENCQSPVAIGLNGAAEILCVSYYLTRLDELEAHIEQLRYYESYDGMVVRTDEYADAIDAVLELLEEAHVTKGDAV